MGANNLGILYQDGAERAEAARDAAARADWQARRDAKQAELERLHRGPEAGPAAVPRQIAELVTALTPLPRGEGRMEAASLRQGIMHARRIHRLSAKA